MCLSSCYIVGAGDFTGLFSPTQSDYIIAADAGYAKLSDIGIAPDLVVGDFDSLGAAPEHHNIMLASADKDDTDIMLAVKAGLARGFKSFIIDGALGGRVDHTFANMQILKYITLNGAIAKLLGHGICITALENCTVGFLPTASGTISIFALDDIVKGVTLEGLKYAINDAVLTNSYPLGISNEFTGKPAKITVRSGVLLVIWEGGHGELVTKINITEGEL